MLKNYLKTAIRNLKKQRTHSIINITGLAVGMTVFILILSFVWFELSFDRYHTKADQIYRVVQTRTVQGKVDHQGLTGEVLALALKEEFPEILNVTRLGYGGWNIDLHYKNNIKIEKKGNEYLKADPSIFEIFDITLVSGDHGTALDDPNSIILTEELAMELYGDEDPMGKIITLTRANLEREMFNNPNKDYIVTGVTKAMPGNSHFDFQFLVPLGKEWGPSFTAGSVCTYIVLPKDYHPERLEEKFPEIIRRYFVPEIEDEQGISYDEWVKSGGICQLNLQSLKDIHMDSYYTGDWRIVRKGSKTSVYILSIIAFSIILLACINFMIMSTARSANRAKEVGIRKIAGSYRGQLILQFLTESIVISILALILSILLVKLLLPTFNDLVGTQISFVFSSAGFILLILLVIALIVGLLAGSYPAFVLSGFKPISALKGNIQGRTRRLSLRDSLIVFQFIISITLIVASLVVYNQLSFMRKNNPGFNKENIVVIHLVKRLVRNIGEKKEKEKEEGYEFNRQESVLVFQAFKQELLKHPYVLSATGSNAVPGGGGSYKTECRPEGGSTKEKFQINWIGEDPDYIETFGHKLIAGRNYSKLPLAEFPKHPYSPEGAVINETAVEYLGWTEPLGKTFIYRGQGPVEDEDGKVDLSGIWGPINIRTQVIGVIKDYHFKSLHTEIQPLAFYPSFGRFISVKIQPDDIPGTLEFLKKTWNTFTPDVPFVYSFLDDDMDRLYRKEKQLSKISLCLTILAVVIACMGLFGLAAITAEQRTKEIGVRKVMGASFKDIIRLLSKTYIKLIIIANLIAWPIGYIVMQKWLQDFAYRINIGVGTFLLTGIIAIMIVIIAVSSQAIKTSLTDPVDSLRYE